MSSSLRPESGGSLPLRVGRTGERGFTLAALLVILTILAMVIAYTVPTMWSQVLRRERDMQTIWVMKQYARSIQEFQKRRGALPTSLEQLKEQVNPRVLRRMYPDPLTGKMDWLMVSPAEARMNQQQMPPGMAPPRLPPRPPMQGGGAQVGPFVGVRPAVTGKSFLSFNGVEQYEEWQYTIFDLQREQGKEPPPVQGVPIIPKPRKRP